MKKNQFEVRLAGFCEPDSLTLTNNTREPDSLTLTNNTREPVRLSFNPKASGPGGRATYIYIFLNIDEKMFFLRF